MLHDAAKRGRRRDPGLLLRAEARRPGRRLPHVPGRDRGDPETADLLLDPGPRRHGRPHPHRAGQGRPERGGRVPARQPPARLPGLRQGRRVPAAGHLDGLGPRQEPVDRRQAPLPEADRALAAGRDRPRALHPLLPLRALQPGGRRGRPAAAAGARRPHLRRHLRRPPLRRALPRQHHRALPGRGADQLHLPLPRPALGHRAGRLGLHALPEPVQRQLHRPRRAGEAGPGPRQPRGRRRLALRPRPLRLRDVRRRGAGRGPRLRGGARASWEQAIAGGGSGPARGRRRRAPRSSATPPTRRATWSSASCARHSAPPTSTPGPPAARARDAGRASPSRSSRRRSRDIDDADAILVVGTDPLHSSPILDLRIRKAIRRNGARLALATERPTALDGGAEAIARYAPAGPPLPRRAGERPARTSAENVGRRDRRGLRGAERSSSSGASGSAATAAAPTPCSTSPRPSTSLAPKAPACSKSPTSPTPAACARPAASPTPARASSRDADREAG